MHLILSKLWQGIVLWIGFFAVGGIAIATITYPSSVPGGESDGWSFATILKQMLENTNLADTTNTGAVKYARDSDKVDGLHASDLLASGGGGWSTTSSIVVLAWHQDCPTWFATFHISAWGKCMVPNASFASIGSSYNATNASNVAAVAPANGEVICWLNGTDVPTQSTTFYNGNSFFVMRNETLYSYIQISTWDQTVCIKD